MVQQLQPSLQACHPHVPLRPVELSYLHYFYLNLVVTKQILADVYLNPTKLCKKHIHYRFQACFVFVEIHFCKNSEIFQNDALRNSFTPNMNKPWAGILLWESVPKKNKRQPCYLYISLNSQQFCGEMWKLEAHDDPRYKYVGVHSFLYLDHA